MMYVDDISNGQENIKISLLNEINSVGPPRFVSVSVLYLDQMLSFFELCWFPLIKSDFNTDCLKYQHHRKINFIEVYQYLN